jgi:hypothetical protein
MKKFVLSIIITAALLGLSVSPIFATPMKESNVDFSGLVQFIYSWDQDQGNDQLSISRARIILDAKPAEKVKFHASLDFSGNTSSFMPLQNPLPLNNLKGIIGSRYSFMDGYADSILTDVYADLGYIKNVTVRVGQFPLPNSYELNIPDYDLESIQYNQGIGTFGLRDRGLIIFGKPSPNIGISGWLTNGAGAISGATHDNSNDRNSYGLQLDISPVDFFSMKVWHAWSDNSHDSWAQDSTSYGAGLDYAHRGFHFYSEFNRADENRGVTSFIANNLYRQWFVSASQRMPHSDLQAVLRYDVFKYSSSIINCNCDREITTTGFNWDFEKNAKLQIMHDFINGPYDETNMQLSLRF